MELPYIEKFRPKVVDDLAQSDSIITKLKTFVLTKNIPNLILSGPPGTGKTSSVYCLAREILGESFKHAILELNASEERGIKTVREKVKFFSQKDLKLPPNVKKIIILDEVDNMTPSAQQAMRRIIENNSDTTRFVFTCNLSSKIIEPIQSRCSIIRFSSLNSEQILLQIKKVVEKENLKAHEDALKLISVMAEGDLRKALSLLQLCVNYSDDLKVEEVEKLIDRPRSKFFVEILKHCIDKNYLKAKESFEEIFNKYGLSAKDFIMGLLKSLEYDTEIGFEYKKKMLRKISETYVTIMHKGINDQIAVYTLLADLNLIKNN